MNIKYTERIENMLERNECNRKSNEILVKNMCVRRCHVFRFALLLFFFFFVIFFFIGLLKRGGFRVDLMICSTNLYIMWGRLQFSFSNMDDGNSFLIWEQIFVVVLRIYRFQTPYLWWMLDDLLRLQRNIFIVNVWRSANI